MKSSSIQIEYVQNTYPFPQGEEYVVIFNGTNKKFDLAGWKLIYEDTSTGTALHTHFFSKLRGSFDPGERLCVLTNRGVDHFRKEGEEVRFPGPHWDLHLDLPKHILNFARVQVRLIDDSGDVLDVMTIDRLHSDYTTQNKISVFIGHGRNLQWRILKDHLQDQHDVSVTAYELGPRAGLSVKEVLEQMLSTATFAILVLTGEDATDLGEMRARENVVHELGLFQGRFGFTRAIALIEEGVSEFTNIIGLNQVRFSKGNIRESFGDILATIRREFPNHL